MKRYTLWIALAAMMLAFPLLACNSNSKKAGVDVNNGWEQAVYNVETGVFSWPLTTALTAGGTLSETPVALMGPGPQSIAIASCYYHTQGSLTHNASNYVTLQVQKRTSGGSPTTIAQLATSSGDWTAFTNVSLPVTAGSFLAPGDSVTFNIGKTGSGVAVPVGQLACFTNMQ
jgi:hypothetical protein